MTKPFPKSEMKHWKTVLYSHSPFHSEYKVYDRRNGEEVGGWVEYLSMFTFVTKTQGWVTDYMGNRHCDLCWDRFVNMKDIRAAMYDLILRRKELLDTFKRPESPFIGDWNTNG